MSSYAAEVSIVDPTHHAQPPGDRLVLRHLLAAFEKSLIVAALLAAGGNQKRAAEALGVLPTTLSEKLRRFGLQAPRRERVGRREPSPARSVAFTGSPHEALTPSPLEKRQ